jgi:hypothetical protein
MVLVRNPNASEQSADYVAQWSPSAAGEDLGQIRPSWFGLPDAYHLRLTLSGIAVA